VYPTKKYESSGLAAIPDLAKEMIVEKLVRRITEVERSSYSTVPMYALLVTDVREFLSLSSAYSDLKQKGLGSYRRGIIVRRATNRYLKDQYSQLDNRLPFELILRKWGMTSLVGKFWYGRSMGYLNIQGAIDHKTVLDFGHYKFYDTFSATPVADEAFHTCAKMSRLNFFKRYACFKKHILMTPGDSKYISRKVNHLDFSIKDYYKAVVSEISSDKFDVSQSIFNEFMNKVENISK
jgi:hypothetical protein